MSDQFEKIDRKIKAAIFDQEIGPVTITELMTMPEQRWRFLRNSITDGRSNSDNGLKAQCMACKAPVYIANRTSRVGEGDHLPYYQHYSGAAEDCPWYSGKNLTPDAARASQYQGNQTSYAHDYVCQTLEKILRQDSNVKNVQIEKYHDPDEHKHGRYPDVYVEWKGRRSTVFEVQLSNTFQTEMSHREMYYDREGCDLIWVLYGERLQDGIMPSSIKDVVHRHRGNAFCLTNESIEASKETKTLLLSCFLQNADGSFESGKLVRFDELTCPERGLAFFEDRIAAPMIAEFHERRKPWFDALKALDHYDAKSDAITNLLPFSTLPDTTSLSEKRFFSAAFSIVAHANGQPTNYVSKHPNLKAMLNTYLAPNIEHGLASFADLLEELLSIVAISDVMTPKVYEHFVRAKTVAQATHDSVEWTTLKFLLPEALDPLVKAELEKLGALPKWVKHQ